MKIRPRHRVWIVGQMLDRGTWSLEMIASTRGQALAFAASHAPRPGTWFIASQPLDAPGPSGDEEWPDIKWVH